MASSSSRPKNVASPRQWSLEAENPERPTLQVSGGTRPTTALTGAPWQETVHDRDIQTSFFQGSHNVNASGRFTKVDGNVHYHYYNTIYHVFHGRDDPNEGPSSHYQHEIPSPGASPDHRTPRAQTNEEDILYSAFPSYSPRNRLQIHTQDPPSAGYPPNSHIRASGPLQSSNSEPAVSTLSATFQRSPLHGSHRRSPSQQTRSRRASLEAVGTPIDQPLVEMAVYPRHGNHSQPELTPTSSRLPSDEDRPSFNQRPQRNYRRKKIDLSPRQVPRVPPPAAHKPSDEDFFTNMGNQRRINHEYLKIHFFREGRLNESQALSILEQATNVFSREPNMISLKSPVTICGDIHGQYYDLMQIFEVGGPLQNSVYLFLGNYVDQGNFGIESLLYLYALKLWDPSRIVLLRGSHECRKATEIFNFKRECLHKYSESVYEACLRSFCALPIAALVDDKLFCVHGGISPQLLTLNHLGTINRFTEPGSYGLLCDLLWSNPVPNYESEAENATVPETVAPTHNVNQEKYSFYTYEGVCHFLERNGLYTIIRGHQLQKTGFAMHRQTAKRNFPSVISLFSAPNHQDIHQNHGAILHYEGRITTIKQYASTPHPYWLPDFANVFEWSLPFVNTQLKNMVIAILDLCSLDEPIGSDPDDENTNDVRPFAARREIIRKKVLAVGRFMIVMQLTREESRKKHEQPVHIPPPSSAGINHTRHSIDVARADASSPPWEQEIFPVARDPSHRTSGSGTSKSLRKTFRIPHVSGKPESSNGLESEGFSSRKKIIKTKILTVGRIQRMFKRLRGEIV